MYKVGNGANGGSNMREGMEEEAAPGLHIRLFGAFEVRVNGVVIPPLRSRKVQWLLALLILRHKQALDRIWLAGTLWPESTHSQSLYNLRQSLSNLRHVLGEAGKCLCPSMVNALFLDVSCATIDVLDFDAGVAAGDVASLERAVALYRGPLLEGCTEEWVHAERRVREESYLSTLENLAGIASASGDGNATVKYLRLVIQTDPLREQAQRALIQAFASVGDYGAAVQTHRELRLMLRRELNTDPDPQTRAVFQQIRMQARLPVRPAPSVSLLPHSDPPRQLPSPLTALVGRKSEMEQIIILLRTARLLTLTGPGGVGKTRLALAVAEVVAEEYPDGVFFVDLAPLSNPALIAQTVASVLQIREEPQRSLLVTLQNRLQSRSLLLLFDNCEHLLDACAGSVDAIQRACPGVCILATSRQSLGLIGEVGWSVPSLSTPALTPFAAGDSHSQQEWLSLLGTYEAIQLFVIRAQQVLPSFQMSADNAEAIAQICAHLDGIPLALELAAARMRSLSVEEINSKLDNRFRLLTGGSRTALPRQQTLRALIDWSYDLLEDREKALLHRLAVFAGGWTLEAAEVVCAGQTPSGATLEEWDVLDLLTGLVDKSLALAETRDGHTRYWLLETVLQYARERLLESGDAEAIRDRHLGFCLVLAEEAEPQLTGPQQVAWLNKLEAEHDNWRAALDWCQENVDKAETGLRLAAALSEFWHMRGPRSEGICRQEEALARKQPATQPAQRMLRAKVLGAVGFLIARHGYSKRVRPLLEESLRLYQELAEPRGIATALGRWGMLIRSQEGLAQSRPFLEQSLALFQEVGDETGTSTALYRLAQSSQWQGDTTTALRLFSQSLALDRKQGDYFAVATSLGALAELARERQDYGTARSLLEERLGLLRQIGSRTNIGITLMSLADLARVKGNYQHAVSLLEESMALLREDGKLDGLGRALLSLGNVMCLLGHFARADALYQESLRIWHEIGDRGGAASALERMAVLAARPEGRTGLQRAARLLGAAQSLRETVGESLPFGDHSEYYDQLVKDVQAALGEAAFAPAFAEGQAMTMEPAIEYALSETVVTSP